MTKAATVETQEEPKAKAPAKESLQEGQGSIIADGKEIVFQAGQTELPGMPEITRLRRLGLQYVGYAFEKMRIEDALDKTKQEIMMELRNEGRPSFGMRENGVTYIFNINAPQEKLEVKKKR